MNNVNETKIKNRFDTIDGATLMSTPLQPLRFVVDSLISQGLHVLTGSPKVGKSWLALWLSVMVAKGEPVWNMQTRQGTTLYLCLEDSRLRIQNRLFEIMEDAPPSVYFCTEGFIIGGGLEERIETFIAEQPDTTLIIIDTLQMVRGTGCDNTYANDYRDLSVLKKLADKHGVAIILIHHLRKEGADDVFNRISGTTGVQGAVDSSFTLIEDKRGSGKAKLSCIGRDIEYREICLERNEYNVWEMVTDSREQPEILGDAIISLLSEFMKSAPHFIGTPTELTDKLFSQGGEKISQRILQNAEPLMAAGISFDIRRSNDKRLIKLYRADGDDSADKSGAYTDTPNIVPVDPVCGNLDAEALPLGEASKASGYTPVALGGALPHTPSHGKEHWMKKQKDKTYAFRVSSANLKKIKVQAKRAKMTVTDYLTACALGKEITIIDGLDSVLSELKAQGRNLNQLTILSHQGRSYPSQIEKLTDAYGDICAELKKLLEVV